MGQVLGKKRNGMKKKDPSISNNKQRQNIEQRVYSLEQSFVQLVPAINQSLGQVDGQLKQLNNNLNNLDRILAAVLDVLGKETTEKVMESVKNRRVQELEDESKAQGERIAVMLAEGKLEKTDKLDSDSNIIVITERDDKGEAKHPIKTYGILSMFDGAVKELLTGKNVCETLTLPTGGTVEILECYKVVEKKEETPVEQPTEVPAQETT